MLVYSTWVSRAGGRRTDSRRALHVAAIVVTVTYVVAGQTLFALLHQWPAMGLRRDARVALGAVSCVVLVLHVLAQPYLPRWTRHAWRQLQASSVLCGYVAGWWLG